MSPEGGAGLGGGGGPGWGWTVGGFWGGLWRGGGWGGAAGRGVVLLGAEMSPGPCAAAASPRGLPGPCPPGGCNGEERGAVGALPPPLPVSLGENRAEGPAALVFPRGGGWQPRSGCVWGGLEMSFFWLL